MNLLLGLCFVTGAFASAASPAFRLPEDFLTTGRGQRVQLKRELTFRELQGGIAGAQGTVWRISPIGEWIRYPIQIDGDQEVALWSHATTGKISTENLREISVLLARVEFQGLANYSPPREKQGEAEEVNPHYFVVSFGDVTKKLGEVGPRRGGPIGENIRNDSHPDVTPEVRDRFATLAERILAKLK